MNSQFLDICGPLQLSKNNCATGVLNLNNYCGGMNISSNALLIEGIHQCAVRLGRMTIENANTLASRVLPVSIKMFEQFNDIEFDKYKFTCSSIPFGHSARVKIKVMSEAQTKIAEAEVTVALMH